jgi:TetR/AcrR family transcriptional regulator, transcriptional repressor for nem operon
MSKGAETRQSIVERAASLFNRRGYAASMQELTEATGLQKGGIYNHFGSKDDLAVESFEYATERIRLALTSRLETIASPIERLRTIPQAFFERYTGGDPFPNGCVVLNTAVEAKRHMTALRERSQRAMRWFLEQVERAIRESIAAGELHTDERPRDLAAVFISTLEGAMLLALLYDDRAYLRNAVRHLHWTIDMLETPASRRRRRSASLRTSSR